ncbi:MAG TPA: type VI secretion system tip protein TssI/VgrG [Bryobacteraceae bacterium]|nr:type VI secretion system tip protein TssI/VgrG [Bryobacteraceae bacterium]
MPSTIFSQGDRVIKINTPLGEDVLLLQGFSGQEAISSLFQFDLDLIAENRQTVAFDKVLGQKVSIELILPDEGTRYFHGIISSFSQGGRGVRFTTYHAEMVPEFWLLTRRVQSRIFQQVAIPDILKKVLQGLDVAFELQGKYEPRDYCVQYRESDFQFASRLMEEEGIYYFFKHAEDGHKMVLADSPQSHPDMPEMSKIIYEEVTGGTRPEERITRWEKVQELRSGKYTLWDHCFELPYKHLEAEKTVLDSLSVGKVAHKLKVGGNDKLEIYEFPGAYAQRFDGIDPGGAERQADLQKVFEDNKRTVGIRMQQETLPALEINGESSCRNLVSGYKFTLTDHFNADGQYIVTSISHVAKHEIGSGAETADTHYSNEFTCIPFALPFRPERSTPRPVVHGSQTAEVVGPKGEEIFTDKYGRVKVQFHWDREGKDDANSSCWVRVASPWAGKNWGMVQIPRIGQEVLIDFLEGDPDQPIIVGSVYNADQMPPYKLPDKKMISGWKSNSTIGGGGYNEMSFDDTKKKEMVTVHAQKDMSTTVEHDDTQTIHNNRAIKVDGTHNETITKDTNITIEKGPYKLDVQNNTHTHHVKGNVNETYDADQHTIVANNILTQSKTAKITIDAAEEIFLHCGQSMMSLKKDGTITISGQNVSVLGAQTVKVGVGNQNVVCDVQKVATSGAAINSNAVGMHTITGAVVKIN